MRTEGGNEWRETGKYGYLRTESMKYVKPLLFIAINKINIKNEKTKASLECNLILQTFHVIYKTSLTRKAQH